MQLVPYSEADLALLEELECDPELMKNLGAYRGSMLRCNRWELARGDLSR
jgi:hypothetical protein